MHANKREEIESISAGDIAAVVGPQGHADGRHAVRSRQAYRAGVDGLPRPGHRGGDRAQDQGDDEKLGQSLARLAMEDPTFKVNVDPETNQTLIPRDGRAATSRSSSTGAARVQSRRQRRQAAGCLRETVRQKAEAQGRFVRQTGGRGQYGDVWLEIEPSEPGAGVVFENKLRGPAIPREYVPAVEKGIKEAAETGVLAGLTRWSTSRCR